MEAMNPRKSGNYSIRLEQLPLTSFRLSMLTSGINSELHCKHGLTLMTYTQNLYLVLPRESGSCKENLLGGKTEMQPVPPHPI